jgi:hypothetical protein
MNEITPSHHAIAAPPTEPHRFQLWFEQFRDIAVMALDLAGGAITLLGTIFSSEPRRGSGFVAVVLLGFAAVTATLGQVAVVDLADRAQPIDRRTRRFRTVALTLLGAGVGAFVTFALRSL